MTGMAEILMYNDRVWNREAVNSKFYLTFSSTATALICSKDGNKPRFSQITPSCKSYILILAQRAPSSRLASIDA